MLFEEWRLKARVARFLRDDVKNSALSSNYGTFEELGQRRPREFCIFVEFWNNSMLFDKLGQRRASRGFSGIADVKNSALSSNYGTTRRWSRSGV